MKPMSIFGLGIADALITRLTNIRQIRCDPQARCSNTQACGRSPTWRAES
jgi:hypothetical protein